MANKTEKIRRWLNRAVPDVQHFGALTLTWPFVYTYNVRLAAICEAEGKAWVNMASYSTTSSGHRNRLIEALGLEGYEIIEVASAEEL